MLHCSYSWNLNISFLQGLVVNFFVTDYILYHLINEIYRNKIFKRNVKRWLSSILTSQHGCQSIVFMKYRLICSKAKDKRSVSLRLTANEEAKLNFQKEIIAWCMTHPKIVERIQLEYMVSSLSTLGGAHSAMGEFYEQHSIKAGVVSVQQYAVALKMNNPILKARCKIYFAQSLMQRGRLKQAAKIIRSEYEVAKDLPGDFELVRTCCLAAWSRYQYLRTLKNNYQ